MQEFLSRAALKQIMIMGLWLVWSAAAASPSGGAKEAPRSCPAIRFDEVTSLAQAARAIACDTVSRQLLIVSDYHGSNEIPDFVGELVSDAAAQRPVRLGLEMETFEQRPIQTYMASGGSADDRTALLHDDFWALGEGRTSQAIVRLLEQLRKLRAEGRNVGVFTTVPDYPGDAAIAQAGGVDAYRSAGMAKAIHSEVAHGAPHQLVIAFMGNDHSAYVGPHRGKEATVAERLLADSPYLMNLDLQGGSVWDCQANGCGPQVLGNPATQHEGSSLLREVRSEVGAPTQVWLRFPPLTASPPAKQKKPKS